MLTSEVIIRSNSSVRKVKLESLKHTGSFSNATEGQNIGLFPFYQVFVIFTSGIYFLWLLLVAEGIPFVCLSSQEELTRMGEVENAITIFVVATYGEGDPTDNAQEFYEWLQNDRDDLDCLNYTVRITL